MSSDSKAPGDHGGAKGAAASDASMQKILEVVSRIDRTTAADAQTSPSRSSTP